MTLIMENKYRFFSLEHYLTFLFLLPLLYFFPQEASPIRIYLFAGFIIGVVTAYISYDKFLYFRKLFTLAASLLILSWTVYSVLKSSFLYGELIVICINSLSFLIVINSFSLCLRQYLGSVQIFGILLFLCLCALTRDYNQYFLILAAGLVSVILIVAKIKFHNLFTYSEKVKRGYRVVSPLLVIVLFLGIFTAWALFMNIPLGQIRTWGASKDEDVITWQEQEPQGEVKNTFLQDEQIQKELTSLTLGLSSTDQMHQVLVWIQDLLVQETPFAFEVSKAEKNILKVINDQSVVPDSSDAAQLSEKVKRYVDRKIMRNLAQIKDNLGKSIDNNHIGLWQRFAVLSAVNKIEYSGSSSLIDKYSQQLKKVINDKFMPDETKKQLNQLSGQLKEWKSYQLLHKKLNSFQNEISAFDEGRKKDLNDLIQRISQMEKVSGSGQIGKTIEKMFATLPPEESKLIGEVQDLLGLKKEMLLSQENSQLRKELEGSRDSLNKPGNLEELLNVIEETKDRQEAIKKISQLLEDLGQMDNIQLPPEARDILEAKLEGLIKESSEVVQKQIKESNLAEAGKSLLEVLRKMASENNRAKLTSSAVKIQKLIDALYKQGKIVKNAKDNLIKNIRIIEQLLNLKIELAGKQNQEKSPDEASFLDYIGRVSELLQSSSLQNEQRELMDKLMEKLAAAQTVSQVEDVLSAINQQISTPGEKIKDLIEQAALAKKDLLQSSSLQNEQRELMDKLMEKLAAAQTVSQVEDVLSAINQQISTPAKQGDTKELEKVKELIQKAADTKKMFILERDSYKLRKNIEILKSTFPQQATFLQENLNKMKETKTKQDLIKNIDALGKSLESKQSEGEVRSEAVPEALVNTSNRESLKIYLLPDYAILPRGSNILLKSVTTYNNFIREAGSELEWSSTDPTIAFVDQRGLVSALGIGQTEILCRFRGLVSARCKVTVVETIPQAEVVRIQSELGEQVY